MGTNQDTIQRAEVLGIAVVCAGPNGTLDALVSVVVHR